MKKGQIQSNFVAIIMVFIAIFVDQWTKWLAVTHLKDKSAIELIENIFELHYLENKGAAFGIMQNHQAFFLISGLFILVATTYIYQKMPQTKRFLLLRICLILIVSGAIGNMIDRLRFQYVIDFLYFKLIDFPIFNVADIYVTVSAIGLVVLILFFYKDEEVDDLFAKISISKKKQEKCDE